MAGTRKALLAGILAAVVITAGACSSSNNTSTTSTSGTSAAPSNTAAKGKKTSEASSDEIKLWQTQLNAVGCDAGPVDGEDGGETEAAIRGFQAASGLPVDGIVGPETESALAKDSAAGKQVCKAPTPATTKVTTASSVAPSTPTTASTECPGPGCVDFSIEPASGPAGTAIKVRAATGLCTMTGVVAMNPTNPPAPSIAAGTIADQGMNQWEGTLTVPAGTPAGKYLVNAWATGAMMSAGECQASFTVTG